MMKVHEHRPELHHMLTQELGTKSLYHVALDLLAEATGQRFDPQTYAMDTPHAADDAVMQAWVRADDSSCRHRRIHSSEV